MAKTLEPYKFAFAVEYEIGHVTFAKTMQEAVATDPDVEAEWLLLRSKPEAGWQKRLLADRNYTFQMGLRVRLGVERHRKNLDCFLIHTQTAALLCWRLMGSLPTVISTDATPRNIDELSSAYLHRQGSALEEEAKRKIIGSLFSRARFVVPSSEWAARSLVEEYHVGRQRIKVVKSGLHLDRWPVVDRPDTSVPRLLFVGGDFARKGGEEMMAALEAVDLPWALDVVTKSDVASSERVRVHRNIGPNDPALHELYQKADIFVFPSRGDAVPWVVLEAMGATLPVLSTRVGAIPEMVTDGRTGIITDAGDVAGLRDALVRLLRDPSLRRQMGRAGRSVIETEHDASKTSAQMLGVMKAASNRDGSRQ